MKRDYLYTSMVGFSVVKHSLYSCKDDAQQDDKDWGMKQETKMGMREGI